MNKIYFLYDTDYNYIGADSYLEGSQPLNSTLIDPGRKVKAKFDPINNIWFESATEQEKLEFIEILTYNRNEELLANRTPEIVNFLFERVPVSEQIFTNNKNVRDLYRETVLSIKPDFVFPDLYTIPIVEFTWRHVATENITQIILPREVDRNLLREVTVNESPVIDPPYNNITRLLQVNMNTGDRLKVLY